MRRLFGHKDDSDAGGAATAIIPGHKRYKMKERMFSFGDDYYIEDEEGHRAFKVDGKMLRLRSTLTIRDAEGHEVAKIQEKWLRVKDSMEIEGPNGERIAMVKKALYTPVPPAIYGQHHGWSGSGCGREYRRPVRDQAGRLYGRGGARRSGFGFATSTAWKSFPELTR